jgi:hypothetical protein
VHYGSGNISGINNALEPLRFVCDIIRGIHVTVPSLYSLLGPMVHQEPQQAHGFTLADNTSAWLASGCARYRKKFYGIYVTSLNDKRLSAAIKNLVYNLIDTPMPNSKLEGLKAPIAALIVVPRGVSINNNISGISGMTMGEILQRISVHCQASIQVTVDLDTIRTKAQEFFDTVYLVGTEVIEQAAEVLGGVVDKQYTLVLIQDKSSKVARYWSMHEKVARAIGARDRIAMEFV